MRERWIEILDGRFKRAGHRRRYVTEALGVSCAEDWSEVSSKIPSAWMQGRGKHMSRVSCSKNCRLGRVSVSI